METYRNMEILYVERSIKTRILWFSVKEKPSSFPVGRRFPPMTFSLYRRRQRVATCVKIREIKRLLFPTRPCRIKGDASINVRENHSSMGKKIGQFNECIETNPGRSLRLLKFAKMILIASSEMFDAMLNPWVRDARASRRNLKAGYRNRPRFRREGVDESVLQSGARTKRKKK